MGVKDKLIELGGTLTSGALNAGMNALTMGAQRRNQEKLMDKQANINEQAADAALAREMQMYDYTYQKQSYAAQRKQLEDAGLSVGLMYGGGAAGAGMGVGGSAPQGGTTGGEAGMANPLQISPTTLAQIENIKAQTEKTRKETEQLGKTGEKTEAETAYTKAQTKWLEENAPIEQYKKLYELMYEAYKNEGKTGESFKFNFNGKELEINGKSYNAQKISNDIAKDLTEIWKQGTEAQKNLAQAAEADQHVKYMIDQITQMAIANQIEFKKVGILNDQLELDWEKFNDIKGQGNREATKLELMAAQVAYDTGTNMNTKNVLSLIFQGLGAVGRMAGGAAIIGAL